MSEADIKLVKRTNAHMAVEADSGILHELSDAFTWHVKGYRFMPAVRNKLWDGKVRFLDLRARQMYCGLVEEVRKFAESRDYSLVIDPALTTESRIDPKSFEYFIKTLKLHAQGVAIHPREYQASAAYLGLKHRRRVLVSPTASGKSLIIYMMARWFLAHNPSQKILIVVPTTALVGQMKGDFLDYAKMDEDWVNSDPMHEIYSGKEKASGRSRIVISTWQSIYKLPASWFSNFGMVIGDEAHQFKAKCLSAIMDKCLHAEYRLGTTGTVADDDVCSLHTLMGVFGPVHRVITTRELMDNNSVAKLKIKALLLNYSDATKKLNHGLKYAEEIQALCFHSGRNRFIANLALAQKCNTLVLYTLVEKHGTTLFDLISKAAVAGRKVFFIHGGVEAEDRNAIRAIVEKETNAIIVASSGTFSVGVNIRNLSTIIFASPSKSQIRVLQSIGRGLRKSDDNRPTTLFDLTDDWQWKSKKNFTLKHGAERVRIYAREKFDFAVHSVDIPDLE